MSRSIAQRIQSRANGTQGGRPANPKDAHGVAAVRRIKERARLRGGASLDKAVKFLVELVLNPTAKAVDRLRAAENLCDRFGFPRMQAAEMTGTAFEGTKYLVLSDFKPPPTFNPMPPTESPEDDTTEH
jgi:hypothetical protein